MANSKANKKVEKVKIKDEELEVVNEELDEKVAVTEEKVATELEEKNKEVDLLKAQLEEMQKMMAQLMQKNAPETMVVKSTEDEVTIGCRVLQGIGWGRPEDPSGEIRLQFNEEQNVTLSDMRRFFRQPNIRQFFIDGLCYFADKSSYELLNIREYLDLSDEALLDMLSSKDTNAVISRLNKITEFKRKSSIVNCIVFRICDMIRKNTLDLDYYQRKSLEDYFGMELERGIKTLKALEAYKKF